MVFVASRKTVETAALRIRVVVDAEASKGNASFLKETLSELESELALDRSKKRLELKPTLGIVVNAWGV